MNLKNSKKRIVFFFGGELPSVMAYKMADLFKKNNYETILFTMSNRERFDEKFFKESFDKIICSNFQFYKPSIETFFYTLRRSLGLIRFLNNIKKVNPHVIIYSGNNWQIKIAHKYFFKNCPSIYFPYDINSLLYDNKEDPLKNGQQLFDINSEKYNFENFNGIMHKGDPDELNHINGRIFDKIDTNSHQITFHPYCLSDFKIPLNKEKLSNKDGEFHIVHIGSLFFGKPFKKMQIFVEEIIKQKIHIHFYFCNRDISKKREKELIREAFGNSADSSYFHLHDELNSKEIIREISKYDFGINISYTHEPEEIINIYGSSNRISSFMEAGIPIIIDDDAKFMAKIINDYKIGIVINEENFKNLRKKIKKLDYKKLEENILKAREKYDMENHFNRIEDFINKVIEENGKQSLLKSTKHNNLYK